MGHVSESGARVPGRTPGAYRIEQAGNTTWLVARALSDLDGDRLADFVVGQPQAYVDWTAPARIRVTPAEMGTSCTRSSLPN
jgi:hypothetical protein